MIQFAFCCVWNWDARPFPTFPLEARVGRHRRVASLATGCNGKGAGASAAAPTAADPAGLRDVSGDRDPGLVGRCQGQVFGLIASQVSGRETRGSRHARAYRDIALSFEILGDAAASQDLQAIAGFFAQQCGAGTPFWFAPPGLSTVQGQAIGTGDGATRTFPLVQSVGSYTETVDGALGRLGGLSRRRALDSGWSVSSGFAPAITFATAPAAGVAITADFTALWLCRFADDVQDFEEFMSMLFALRTLKLTTARP